MLMRSVLDHRVPCDGSFFLFQKVAMIRTCRFFPLISANNANIEFKSFEPIISLTNGLRLNDSPAPNNEQIRRLRANVD